MMSIWFVWSVWKYYSLREWKLALGLELNAAHWKLVLCTGSEGFALECKNILVDLVYLVFNCL
jgi:hypothetical protein